MSSTSVSQSSVDDLTFTKAYLHLLNVKVPEPVLGRNYVGDKNWSILSLPPMPQAKKKTNIEETTDSTVKVTLKSIRNPRFTIEFDDIPSSDSVLSIKERLIGDPDGPLADGGYSTSNVKLLVKGKVISDSKSIGDVATDDEVSFVAMISAPDLSSKVEDEPEAVDSIGSELSESAWNDINSILQKNLTPENAKSTLEKFKSHFK